MPRRWFWRVLILLAAAALRVTALAQDVRFHPDEALFTTFARNAIAHGDWLLHGDLDKPPLTIYANALSLAVFAARYDRGVPDFDVRTGEFAARLPGTFASLLLVPVVYALTRRLYRQPDLALWTAMLVALSPLAIAYSASAYTDGLMLLFAVLSLWRCAAGRSISAGVWMALAFACKPQALVLLPLGAVFLWIAGGGWQALIRFAVPIAAMFAALLGWDALRRPSPPLFALAAAHNNPARLIRSDEVNTRLITWGTLAQFMIGAPTALFAGIIPVSIGWRVLREPRRRDTLIDLVLLIYLLAYAFAYWLIAFDTYDRYLLPILPVLAILTARASSWLWRMLSRVITQPELIVAAGAVVLSLLSGARDASVGNTLYNAERYDVGDIIALANTLNALPTATVIYDHWLGWELDYYMGAWNDKRRVYYPTPLSLAQGAAALDEHDPRYFAAPSDQALDVWLAAVRRVGFSVEQSYAAGSYVVYRFDPP